MRRALGVLAAIRSALSAAALDKAWFEAIAETEQEAEAMHNDHQAQVKCSQYSEPSEG